MAGSTIPNAPSGEDSSIDESEKFPVSGSKWMSLATVVEYLRTKAQTLTNKILTSPVLTTPQINDTSADHQYVVAVNELAADRTVTLPLLGAADEFVFKDHAVTLANKTLTTPTIASFANATHNHKNAAGGGAITTYLTLEIAATNFAAPADATTYYIGNSAAPQTTETLTNPSSVPIAGTVIAVYGTMRNNTNSSNEQSTISLRLNETTDTTISSTLVNNANITSFSVTGLSVAVAAADRLRLKWVTPTWVTTDPANVLIKATILMTVALP